MHTNTDNATRASVKGRQTGENPGRSILFAQGNRTEWIGYGQIEHIARRRTDPKDPASALEVTITIPVWLAEKCGFEYEEAS